MIGWEQCNCFWMLCAYLEFSKHVHEFGNPGKNLNFESVIKKLDNKRLRQIDYCRLRSYFINSRLAFHMFPNTREQWNSRGCLPSDIHWHCSFEFAKQSFKTIRTTRPFRPRVFIVFRVLQILENTSEKLLGKQPREFYCSRVFGNPGKTLALVYEISRLKLFTFNATYKL
jgi:hypothetical protein